MGVSRAWMDGGIVASAALFLISQATYADPASPTVETATEAKAESSTQATPAVAQLTPTDAPAGDTAAAEPSAASPKKPKSPKKSMVESVLEGGPQLRVSGRVFARAVADERERYERKWSIPTARIGIEGTLSSFQGVLEADVAERNILQDAYIRVRSANHVARVYAGQFKAPFLARFVESSWSLPIIGRGVVADVLVDRHGLGGRRLGAMGELKWKDYKGLNAQLGLFEGSRDSLGQRTSEDASAHVGFEPLAGVKVGAGAYGAQVFRGTPRYGVGVDASWKLGGFEVTGEALQGRIALGPFAAALGIASFTLPLDKEGRLELEPVVSGELLQLRGATTGRGYAGTGGLNLIYDRRLRLQLELERAFKPGDLKPANTFGVQLATRF